MNILVGRHPIRHRVAPGGSPQSRAQVCTTVVRQKTANRCILPRCARPHAARTGILGHEPSLTDGRRDALVSSPVRFHCECRLCVRLVAGSVGTLVPVERVTDAVKLLWRFLPATRYKLVRGEQEYRLNRAVALPVC